MRSKRHRAALLPGNRLHLSEGPIDLIISADGASEAVGEAYHAAERRFDGLLAELVAELPLLRLPLGPPSPHATPTAPNASSAWGEGRGEGRPHTPAPAQASAPHPRIKSGAGSNPLPVMPEACLRHDGERGFSSPIARRMAEACWPYRAVYITPMAAVAGAVAEGVLAAMTAAAPLARAYVNNGGDIAIHLTQGTSLAIGVVRSLEKAVPEGEVRIAYAMPVRGVATSGRHGRSFSLGIADAVTVLARDAPSADAAATIIANAVNVDDPAIIRRAARQLDPDTDLGDLPVVVGVGPLLPAQIAAALDAGVARAETLRHAGLIEAALLTLAGAWRSVGAPETIIPSGRSRIASPAARLPG